MKTRICLDAVYVPSEDVVFREVEGEPIIVPLTAGIGNIEDTLFTMNETGRAIWDRLDSQKSLKDVVEYLSAEFKVPVDEIQGDVMGFVEELLKRGILVEVSTV